MDTTISTKFVTNGTGREAQARHGNASTCIHAELAWSDTATALGIVAHSYSPIIGLCRMLVEAGCDPASPLEAWRSGTLCLRVRAIGEAAELRVNPKGTGFVKGRSGVPTAPPMRRTGGGYG